MNYNKIAEILDSAAFKAKATSQLSHQQSMNLEEAYAIQSISMSRRYRRGEKWVGLKMGFTSKAKMEQMGIHDLIWGRLTDKMHIKDGAQLKLSSHIHPRAEPEIAFLLNDIKLEQLNVETVKSKVKAVTIAIEVIDSRYENFKFSLEDVIADNCSSAGYALGKWLPVSTNIQDVKISLSINDEIVQAGNSNAILGNPWESLVAAVRLAKENGESLGEDSIILAGAATPAVYLKLNDEVSATANGLGAVSFSVK
ncbi:UNVERIFIED_CONTAM: hypothetical protein GTU68_005633 [Idotea baltica]|nr:hypothetical protein [Idotea baltica]